MVNVAVGPFHEVSGLLQASAVDPEESTTGADVAADVLAIVGSPVDVGSDGSMVWVGIAVSVGGDV
jgi:hypothetical protein